MALGHRLHRVGRARDGDGVPGRDVVLVDEGIIVAAVPAFGADSAGTSVTARSAAWMSYRAARSRRRSVSAPEPAPASASASAGPSTGTAGPTGRQGPGRRVRAGSGQLPQRALGRCMARPTCRCVGAGSGRGAGLAAVVVLALGVLAAVGLASGGALDLRASSHPRHGRGDDGHGGHEGEPGHDCQDSKGDGGREGGQ